MSVGLSSRPRSHLTEEPLARFRQDVWHGLRLRPKQLPAKYFYDAAGSALFERITTLREYYLTRTETGIMRRAKKAMAAALGRNVWLIEYGSGSSTKTRTLLDALDEPAAYMPVDISREHLRQSAARIAADYRGLRVIPVCGDFTRRIRLSPECRAGFRRIVYFPGSTLGNFTPTEALGLLRRTARLVGPEGGMLLGLDCKKAPAILHAAYNDRAGVTAQFNRNVLLRINRELDADFAADSFHHYAFYDPAHGRIEMHLVSSSDQVVHVAGQAFELAEGEPIRTEYSYKYGARDWQALARDSGFRIQQVWTDPRHWFAVIYMTAV
jgi:L-histidine N-alpha-methyltransferase